MHKGELFVLMTVGVFHVECLYAEGIDTSNSTITKEVERRLMLCFNTAAPVENSEYCMFGSDNILEKALKQVLICEPSNTGPIFYHYTLSISACMDAVPNEEGEDERHFSAMNLPHVSLKGAWERLLFESKVNQRILSYASTIMATSSKGIDLRLFDLNKIVMLHGEPGCGKTSLCRALSQKLAIRAPMILERDCKMKLVEVHCHSLFSKWFSESGKQIKLMFEEITRLATEPESFICLLIDEIESISISRQSLFKSSEPSDTIRSVNVLLTQLDKIRELDNVLIMVTSNLLDTVDAAFMDRVDAKFKLGVPSRKAKYEILSAGVKELILSGFLEDFVIESFIAAELNRANDGEKEFGAFLLSLIDADLANYSGRKIRKLPFLALSESIKSCPSPIPCEVYALAMKRCATADDDEVYY